MHFNQQLKICLLVSLLVAIAACSKPEQGVAAPLGAKAALEKLATAYEQASEPLPVSPVSLAPKARRKFVENVFAEAGYDYIETLASISNVKKENFTKLHKDMLELLSLPHYRMSQEDYPLVYSEDEIKLINKIEEIFN